MQMYTSYNKPKALSCGNFTIVRVKYYTAKRATSVSKFYTYIECFTTSTWLQPNLQAWLVVIDFSWSPPKSFFKPVMNGWSVCVTKRSHRKDARDCIYTKDNVKNKQTSTSCTASAQMGRFSDYSFSNLPFYLLQTESTDLYIPSQFTLLSTEQELNCQRT